MGQHREFGAKVEFYPLMFGSDMPAVGPGNGIRPRNGPEVTNLFSLAKWGKPDRPYAKRGHFRSLLAY
jgi:hypothetical protein